MPPDYNFWVYIVTNEHDSVLYIGMTNDLAQDQPASRGRDAWVYRGLPLPKIDLLRTLHRCARRHRTRKAAQEMVAIEESGVDRNDEPTVERSRARSSRRIVRDVSTSLDMTERALKGAAILWSARSLPSLSFRAKSRNL